MAAQRKILVTGATGKVGGAVVAQLAAAGADVRAVVRDPAAANLPAGVEVVRGDLSDPASLDEPLRDVDAVFLVWPFLDAHGAAEVIAAIRRHARRVVYLSAAGVDLDADRQPSVIHEFHAELERLIERSGLDWVSLRPFSFASNNLGWADQLRTGVVRSPGAREVRAPIHEWDIAAVAVRALTSDALLGTRPELSGPEALSTVEQAHAIGAALGMPVRFEEVPAELARAQALDAGYPADLVAALFDDDRPFVSQPVTPAVEQITGRAPRSIREWALDHADAFR